MSKAELSRQESSRGVSGLPGGERENISGQPTSVTQVPGPGAPRPSSLSFLLVMDTHGVQMQPAALWAAGHDTGPSGLSGHLGLAALPRLPVLSLGSPFWQEPISTQGRPLSHFVETLV